MGMATESAQTVLAGCGGSAACCLRFACWGAVLHRKSGLACQKDDERSPRYHEFVASATNLLLVQRNCPTSRLPAPVPLESAARL